MKKHREEMMCISKRKNTYNSRMKEQIRKQTARTTKILLVILALFVVAEAPHGIYGFLAAWYGPKFFWKHYYYGIEIFNTFIHVAESFNFVVYYTMSRQFRSTFIGLFSVKSKKNQVTPQRSISSSLPGVDKPRFDSTGSSSIVTISSIYSNDLVKQPIPSRAPKNTINKGGKG